MSDFEEIPMDSPPLRRFALKPPEINVKLEVTNKPTRPCWFVQNSVIPAGLIIEPCEFPDHEFKSETTYYAGGCPPYFSPITQPITHYRPVSILQSAISQQYQGAGKPWYLGASLQNSLYASRVANAGQNLPVFEFNGATLELWEVEWIGGQQYQVIPTGNKMTWDFPAYTFNGSESWTYASGNPYTDPDYFSVSMYFRPWLGFGAVYAPGYPKFWATKVNPLIPTGSLCFTSNGWEVPCNLGTVKFDMSQVQSWGSSNSFVNNFRTDWALQQIKNGVIPAGMQGPALKIYDEDGYQYGLNAKYMDIQTAGFSVYEREIGVASSQLADSLLRDKLDPLTSRSWPVKFQWNYADAKYNMRHSCVNLRLGIYNPANFEEPTFGVGAQGTYGWTEVQIPEYTCDGSMTISVPDNQPVYGPMHF